MIKVTDEMIEAGQQALRDDGWSEDAAGECDLKFIFSAMYEEAPRDTKHERMAKDYGRELDHAIEYLKQKDRLIGKMMKLIMTQGYPPRPWEERRRDLRDLCRDEGWCIRCDEYHGDGFCDADDYA